MAEYYGPSSVVLDADIDNASRKIAACTELESQGSAYQFGSTCNQWQKPVSDFGRSDPQWIVKLKASPYVGEIDFGRKEWARSREAVDAVMELLLKELRAKSESYEHLRINSYIRQGSSREGLKVIKPNEYDSAIEFQIDGLQFEQMHVLKSGKSVPGFCYLKVLQTPEVLQTRFPKLWRKEVFRKDAQGIMHLSARLLHQAVFESLIDQSICGIVEKVNTRRRMTKTNFYITRRMNPPALNITIHLDDDANELFMVKGQMKNRSQSMHEIDIDIVPAIRLAVDEKTTLNGKPVNANIYGVCKWKEEEAVGSIKFADQYLIWQIISGDYERYIVDFARNDEKQRYILTALRIVKTYFTRTNATAKKENRPPPPIATILKSYHLKQVAFYLIFYSCYVHPGIQIDGAQTALGCFLTMLETALEKRRLPHFFYSNSRVQSMLQNYPRQVGALRFDLFWNIPRDALNQASLSLKNHLDKDLGFSKCGDSIDQSTLISSFSGEIDNGSYF